MVLIILLYPLYLGLRYMQSRCSNPAATFRQNIAKHMSWVTAPVRNRRYVHIVRVGPKDGFGQLTGTAPSRLRAWCAAAAAVSPPRLPLEPVPPGKLSFDYTPSFCSSVPAAC